MKHTPSLELSLQIAAQEAAGGGFTEIEPEHLLIGLLKLAEFSLEGTSVPQNSQDVVQSLLEDVERINAILRRRNLESTPLRRKLRSRLGLGRAAANPQAVHRSPASRKLFEEAAVMAQSEGVDEVLASHLFKAVLAGPTPLIRELVQVSATRDAKDQRRDGQILAGCPDLRQLAATGQLRGAPNRGAEARALGRVLGGARSKSILGIGPTLEDGLAAVHALAAETPTSPAVSQPPIKRLIDITALLPAGKPTAEKLDRVRVALAEASEAIDVILVVALHADDQPRTTTIWSIVENAILETRLQVIALTTPAVYEIVIAQSRRFLWRTHLMWFRSEPTLEIPKVL